MRFASFSVHGVPTYGVVTETGLRAVGSVFLARYPSLKAAIAGDALQAAAAAALANPRIPDPAGVAYQPVIPDAGKILCVGVNYLAHMKEMGREPPAHPFMFVRFNDSLVGHECSLVRPAAWARARSLVTLRAERPITTASSPS
jgi:2-keto-4-pentenoate hydratase/2-oxohepta-3-ene-1,7-dioic acid hydratase in catechol pathway